MKNKLTLSALAALKAQFPTATQQEIQKASRPAASQSKYFTRTAKGIEEVPEPPVKGFYKERQLPKQLSPKKKTPKLKSEVWLAETLQVFFCIHQIIASKTSWFITFNNPPRKMTNEDQLQLSIKYPNIKFDVEINRLAKHLIINTLKGY